MVVSSVMLGSLKMQNRISHRRFLTHTPVFGLVIGLTMYVLSNSLYGKYFALVFLAAFASHMVVDSIELGIMWLWPFSKKQYFLFDANTDSQPYMNENLLMFYVKMFRNVYMRMKTFYVGAALVVIALAVFFTN
ncbi:MAG TPA: metal-dependent hydrolase, partial [Candidatus Limnocylindria bacterium]|nr:metal-dependent hydrolase [Candidatus Limnocylindria bacterium]